MQRLALAFAAVVLLAACGTKGPLYLPPPQPAKPAPAPEAAPQSDHNKAGGTARP